MSSTPCLTFTRKDEYLILTIERPNALNALNQQVFDELGDFFEEGYLKYSPLWGIIITGAGEKAFVAGADIRELSNLDNETAATLVERGHRIFSRIENFHLPVVAAVNGYALGGGCELAMACHLRLASNKARFGLPELGLGLIPGYGGTQRLIQCIGKTRAMEHMLTGSFIDSSQAEQYGLTNKTCSPEDLLESSLNILRQISSKGPEAVKMTIQSVNAYFDCSKDGFEVERQSFAALTQHPEAKEGLNAFLEKRKANFRQ